MTFIYKTMYNTMKIMKVKEIYQSRTEQIKFYKPRHDCIWIAYYSTFAGVIKCQQRGKEEMSLSTTCTLTADIFFSSGQCTK